MRRLQRWLRTESVGITVPVGVVTGFALFEVFHAVGLGLMVPYSRDRAFEDSGVFVVTIAGVTIDSSFVIPPLIGVLLLVIVGSVVFLLPAEGVLDERAPGHRECPHCRSEIRADATRCAFCAEPVDPLDAEPVAAAVD